MIRAIIISLVLMGGTFALSHTFFGYERAGKFYIGKQKKKRKSVRSGSHYYYGHYGSRGIRGGK